MPFQYMWQYQNTETTVLAQDIVDIINANNLLPFDCSQCSGGGAVNTAGYIPVSDGSQFADSKLYYTTDYLKTSFTPDPGNTIWGIEFDYATRNVMIGDNYAGLQANTVGANTIVYAIDANGPAGNQTILFLNGSSQLMKTHFGVNGDGVGFNLDFANGLYSFGEYAGPFNSPHLKVDVNNTMIDMSLDGNSLFKLGLDIDGIVMNADQSASSAGLSGQYLSVKVNGVAYKLALYSL